MGAHAAQGIVRRAPHAQSGVPRVRERERERVGPSSWRVACSKVAPGCRARCQATAAGGDALGAARLQGSLSRSMLAVGSPSHPRALCLYPAASPGILSLSLSSFFLVIRCHSGQAVALSLPLSLSCSGAQSPVCLVTHHYPQYAKIPCPVLSSRSITSLY